MKNKAFSLIEMLITLIILSLVLSAFIPLITKKLKANNITVGSFGNASSGGVSIQRNVTKEDCINLNAIYVPAGVNVPRPLCVMKYNIGDSGIEDWAGVKKCEAGKDCEVQNGNSEEVTKENLQPACWVATSDKNTATAGACNNNFGGYDGCKRTLCNWTGANQMCSNIGWRLPTKEELIAFTNDTYSSKDAFEKGNGSLMFCDYSTSSISPQCQSLENGCPGTIAGHCGPTNVWSSSFETTSEAWNRNLNSSWYEVAFNLNNGFSARCVIDTINENIQKPGGDEKENKEPTKNFCDQFNAYFVDKAVSGLDRNLCITKWNVGDSAGLNSPSIAVNASVSVLNTSQTCANGAACCWAGRTAEEASCSSGKDGGSYSGCTRTVCNYQGAYLSCYNWQYNDLPKGSWRLPKKEEIQYIALNSATTIKNQGENGVQLCDGVTNASTSNGFTHCYWSTGKCRGARGNNCMTYHLWLDNTYNENINTMAAYCDLGGINIGKDGCNANNTGYTDRSALSARCVYDGLNYSETEGE